VDDDQRALAAFQSALLEALYESADPADAKARLERDPASRPFSDYIESFELRGIEVGQQLVHQWSVREPGPSSAPQESTMLAAMVRRVNAPVEVTRVARGEVGPGQVRIRIAASGVCGTDLHIVRGAYPLPLPLTIGHEPVGTVIEVGEGVRTPRAGERVGVRWVQKTCGACQACRAHRPAYCARPRTWIQGGGGHAETMIAEATGCTPIPDALDFELAAPLFCAGHTVMSGLARARPAAGDRVAVLGIGGLGHLAIQIAKALGHEVVAVTRTADKRSEALALGADLVLVAEHDPGEALAQAGGADIALATSDALEWTARTLSGMRPEGRLSLMAVGAEKLSVSPMSLIARQIEIVGARPSSEAELRRVLDLAAAGRVRPRVELYPLGRINQALTRLAEGAVRYRAVLSL
jgi:D-arabinose 1-dehydrogenase-like Zn-dependent alcohol dehydrogenase